MATPTTRTQATPTRTTRTRRHAEAALARCLEPVDAETFFAEHWERRPLAVPRDEPGRFDDLLSEVDVERLVCSTAIRYPAFRLVREGSQLAVGEYTRDVSWRPPFTSTADVPRVLAEWEAGATIVLQAMHVNWHPLAVFCRLLEDALDHGVQANAYYTPRDSQGFAVHHDTHDVLVLQVAGEKRWLLYDPLLELPLKHQRYSSALGEHGEPTDDLVLRAPGSTRQGTPLRNARTTSRSGAAPVPTAPGSSACSASSSTPTSSGDDGDVDSSTRAGRSAQTGSRSCAPSSGSMPRPCSSGGRR